MDTNTLKRVLSAQKVQSSVSDPKGIYRGARPALISRRQRALSRTTPSSVAATAVHSRLRNPTVGRSLGS